MDDSETTQPRRRRKLRWILLGGATLVLVVLFVLMVVFFRRPAYATWPARGGKLVVASYNIKWGNHDWQTTADLIRRTGADVVLIQESSVDAQMGLQLHLGGVYRDMDFRNAASRCGFAILSKYPLRNVRTLLRDNGTYYLAMLADVQVGERRVALANVHLRYKQLLSSTESVRAREITRVYKLLPPDRAAIVAGDFNSFSHQWAPTFLRACGFVDSLAAVNGDSQRTWHWRKGPLRVATRIDYVFHSPHFRTLAGHVMAEGPSDHYPVVSVLQWSADGPARPVAASSQSATSQPAR